MVEEVILGHSFCLSCFALVHLREMFSAQQGLFAEIRMPVEPSWEAVFLLLVSHSRPGLPWSSLQLLVAGDLGFGDMVPRTAHSFPCSVAT